MKVALVTIARNEDYYIDEWLKYNIKLGFTQIFVYQNNWRYKGDKTQYSNVIWIEYDGQGVQTKVYNEFVVNYRMLFDWAAFFDVDEYLVFTKNTDSITISKELQKFSDISVIGIPWRLFGSNGKPYPTMHGNHSMVDRFVKSNRKLSRYKKLLVNFHSTEQFVFADPHYFLTRNKIIDTTRTYSVNHSLFPIEIETDVRQTMELNHYRVLNFDEYVVRKSCGDVYHGDKYRQSLSQEEISRQWHNDNDESNAIVNMSAFNFKHDITDNDIRYCNIGIDGGRMCNQLYSILQVYNLTKTTGILHKCILSEKFANQLSRFNIKEYVISDNTLPQNAKIFDWHDLGIDTNIYCYAKFGIDFTIDVLNAFILECILSNCNIQKNNSVMAIHVRNTDYFAYNGDYIFNFEKYLKVALNNNKLECLDVFSDDISFTQHQYQNVFKQYFKNIEYIHNDDPIDDLLQLSQYENKILWNSTFSYWSGYISNVLFGNNQQQISVPDFHCKHIDNGKAWQLNPLWKQIAVER